MQWLIDLVIAAIGIPPCYIDRGNFTGGDFALPDVTRDGAWHTLDLSGIIDTGATSVALRLTAATVTVTQKIRMRKHGLTVNTFTCCLRTQVSNLVVNSNPVIGVSADGKIDYWFDNVVWANFSMVVRGWWK